MLKRLLIYLFILVILGAVCVGASSYGDATMDLEKTNMGLKTVNGTDADYVEYRTASASYSYIQTYVPWLSIAGAVCLTYFMWHKPAIEVFQKSKQLISEHK